MNDRGDIHYTADTTQSRKAVSVQAMYGWSFRVNIFTHYITTSRSRYRQYLQRDGSGIEQ